MVIWWTAALPVIPDAGLSKEQKKYRLEIIPVTINEQEKYYLRSSLQLLITACVSFDLLSCMSKSITSAYNAVIRNRALNSRLEVAFS